MKYIDQEKGKIVKLKDTAGQRYEQEKLKEEEIKQKIE